MISGLYGSSLIVGGWNHFCIINLNGEVQCRGFNLLGQLGDGTTTESTTFVNVLNLPSNGVVSMAAGGQHTCALLDTSEVMCWGYNSSGQLGNGLNSPSLVPLPVLGL